MMTTNHKRQLDPPTAHCLSVKTSGPVHRTSPDREENYHYEMTHHPHLSFTHGGGARWRNILLQHNKARFPRLQKKRVVVPDTQATKFKQVFLSPNGIPILGF